MKYFFQFFSVFIALSLVASGIFYFVCNEPLPVGTEGSEADLLAQKMLKAIHFEEWEKTDTISWAMLGHSYVWNKKGDSATITWDNLVVHLDLNEVKGTVFENGSKLTGEEANEKIQKAWKYFCNDSFWLNAPAKAFDPGTKRAVVETEEGEKALLVSYSSGGVTPGDSFLWLLDEEGLPKSYKMWVSILPIGGLEASWEGWKTLSTGAKVAILHRILFLKLVVEIPRGRLSPEK